MRWKYFVMKQGAFGDTEITSFWERQKAVDYAEFKNDHYDTDDFYVDSRRVPLPKGVLQKKESIVNFGNFVAEVYSTTGYRKFYFNKKAAAQAFMKRAQKKRNFKSGTIYELS